MHKEQKEFCERVKQMYPAAFTGRAVADVGSMDINGTNRYLFSECTYVGIDLIPGKNVDIVTPVHLYEPVIKFDTIISTEMLEHDLTWMDSIIWMHENLQPGGLLIITCASTGRAEHGTKRTNSQELSVGTGEVFGDYYRNLTEADFRTVIDFDKHYSKHCFEYNATHCDLYLYAIKNLQQ